MSLSFRFAGAGRGEGEGRWAAHARPPSGRAAQLAGALLLDSACRARATGIAWRAARTLAFSRAWPVLLAARGHSDGHAGGRHLEAAPLTDRFPRPSLSASRPPSLQDQNLDASYSAVVQVGTPAQDFDLILDTGSSDLCVAFPFCSKPGTAFSQPAPGRDASVIARVVVHHDPGSQHQPALGRPS